MIQAHSHHANEDSKPDGLRTGNSENEGAVDGRCRHAKRYKYPILSPGTVGRWDCRRIIRSIGTQFSESARDEWPECDDVRLDRAPVPSWSERPLGSVATTKLDT
jgi:hypothetical protein